MQYEASYSNGTRLNQNLITFDNSTMKFRVSSKDRIFIGFFNIQLKGYLPGYKDEAFFIRGFKLLVQDYCFKADSIVPA